LDQWQDTISAIPTRFSNARNEAAQALEPKAQRVTLPSATIKTPDDLCRLAGLRRDRDQKKLADGP